MIRAQSAQSPAAETVSLIQAWLSSDGEQSGRQLAKMAKVDEKTLRLALNPKWNPRVNTIEKIYRLIPADWQAPKKRRPS